MSKNIDIAIINAGGKGSRFRPFTNTIPKEMLPLDGIPVIEYAIDECVEANIPKVIISIREGNNCIEEYLRTRDKYQNCICDNMEDFLEPGFKILISATKINGLYGNALFLISFQTLLKHKIFAVLFGDDVIYERNSIKELQELYEESDAVSIIASKRVSIEEIPNYGNLRIGEKNKVLEFVQKPSKKEEIVSDFAVVSRLILDDSIFDFLEVVALEEVDLGRALNKQAQEKNVLMKEVTGTWLCVDSPVKYMMAQNVIAQKNCSGDK